MEPVKSCEVYYISVLQFSVYENNVFHIVSDPFLLPLSQTFELYAGHLATKPLQVSLPFQSSFPSNVCHGLPSV
jgi:hypothetical protein